MSFYKRVTPQFSKPLQCLLFLKNDQPKKILMPKRHILWRQVLPPSTLLGYFWLGLTATLTWDRSTGEKHANLFNTSLPGPRSLHKEWRPREMVTLTCFYIRLNKVGNCRPRCGRLEEVKNHWTTQVCVEFSRSQLLIPDDEKRYFPPGIRSTAFIEEFNFLLLGECRKVGVFFLVPAVFRVPFTQNHPNARATCFGVACSELLHH